MRHQIIIVRDRRPWIRGYGEDGVDEILYATLHTAASMRQGHGIVLRRH